MKKHNNPNKWLSLWILGVMLLTFALGLLTGIAHAEDDLLLANMMMGANQPAAGADPCAATACSACDGQERFECGSTAGDDDSDQENTVTYTNGGAAVNDAYTADALEGSESLLLDTDDDAKIGGLTATDGDLYVAWIAKCGTVTEAVSLVRLEETDGTDIVRGYIGEASGDWGNSRFYYDATNDYSAVPMDGDAPVYMKLKYNNSSGASDGVIQFWFSSNGANGNWTLQHDISGVANTNQAGQISLESDGDDIIFDDVRWDTSDIDY